MPRIIGGEARGRRLRSLPGRLTRPTADRVKEALFNIISHRVPGAHVLDLFAGTGNLGLEALSRGGRAVVFVDVSAHCARVIRENLAGLGWAERGRVMRGDVRETLARLARTAGVKFDLVFLDPPYRAGLVLPAIEALAAGDLVAAGGIVVAEHDMREEISSAPPGFVLIDQRRYGETILSFISPVACREAGETGEFPT